LISEIACLEVSKADGLDEVMLCKYVEMLAAEIGKIEQASEEVQTCFSPTGAIRPKQLNINISAVFCVAARIFLCALVPGFEPRQPSMCHLISKFSDLMRYIPAGAGGFDRSLVWPLLVAGSMSMADSPFRSMFAERCDGLGDAANFGSFGRVRELLHDVWRANDSGAGQTSTDQRAVRWREVMQQKNWDCLLI
ncbi:MAG: hypothetical protein INR71_05465, partial [Terriglobus roseus]|nr:hypothetical protein [Terriglobus roseus]